MLNLSRLLLRHFRIEKGEKVFLNKFKIEDWLWDLARFVLGQVLTGGDGSILEEEQRDEAFEEQVDEGVEVGEHERELGMPGEPDLKSFTASM